MCDWKGEALEGGFRASFFKPVGVLVRECDEDEFIRREGAQRVLDRFHRVGITDPRLDVVGRCRLRKLVGPFGCVSAGVVLGVCQPVEPGDVGGWHDDEHLCILARVRTDRPAQIGRGDGGSGDDEQPTRHGFSLSARLRFLSPSSLHGRSRKQIPDVLGLLDTVVQLVQRIGFCFHDLEPRLQLLKLAASAEQLTLGGGLFAMCGRGKALGLLLLERRLL
jgi:hypothetical protein